MTFETVSEATRLCGALHRWRAFQAGFYSRLHCGPTPDPDPGSATITIVRDLHLGSNITSPIRKHYMIFLVGDSPSARLSIVSNFEFILTQLQMSGSLGGSLQISLIRPSNWVRLRCTEQM